MADLTALALAAADGLRVEELHGAVCGLAMARDGRLRMQDLVDLLGTDSLTDQQAVEAFVHASLDALLAEDLSFNPLLPEEDAPLDARAAGLGEWCSSFLAGFAMVVARRTDYDPDSLPVEVQEIVSDFTAISQVDVESSMTADDEADFAQLQEFVKVGVLLVMSMMLEPPAGQDDAAAEEPQETDDPTR